ncbi:hypothetical protein AVEN_264100-1 [Araneus ventricosus]|uniref:Uncharacterized protein n=1 Tax=Araneus ventricosus TaxID=182803 RepID=A0A4Y2WGJ3_ARAVE|nr:hypothetical protein AVEN_193728-1 [Araneus ventricosus]GBO36324.1 hypothetical protein AVEN_264100-1 [Araneus ventricosus]
MQQKIDLIPTRGNCGISSQGIKSRVVFNVLPLVWWPQPTPTDSPIGFRVHRGGRKSFGVVRKFEEEVPEQESSSSSDRGSKSQGHSTNSPRVAFKVDVYITKLN